MNNMDKKSEKWLEAELVKRVKKLGGHALKFTSMTEIGYPDRCVLMPLGLTYWVELKSEGEHLRKIQKYRKKELESIQHKVYVIDSEQSLEDFMKEITIDQVWGEK